jgi:hypothetical protein
MQGWNHLCVRRARTKNFVEHGCREIMEVTPSGVVKKGSIQASGHGILFLDADLNVVLSWRGDVQVRVTWNAVDDYMLAKVGSHGSHTVWGAPDTLTLFHGQVRVGGPDLRWRPLRD